MESLLIGGGGQIRAKDVQESRGLPKVLTDGIQRNQGSYLKGSKDHQRSKNNQKGFMIFEIMENGT